MSIIVALQPVRPHTRGNANPTGDDGCTRAGQKLRVRVESTALCNDRAANFEMRRNAGGCFQCTIVPTRFSKSHPTVFREGYTCGRKHSPETILIKPKARPLKEDNCSLRSKEARQPAQQQVKGHDTKTRRPAAISHRERFQNQRGQGRTDAYSSIMPHSRRREDGTTRKVRR